MARLFSTASITGLSPTPINFEYNQPFTAAGWFYCTTVSTEQCLFGHADPPLSYRGWELNLGGAVGTLRFFLINTYPTFAIEKRIATTVSVNTWFHYTVTYSGSGAAAGVNNYVNGTVSNAAPTVDTLSSHTTVNTIKPRVGARINDTLALAGNAADCAVWNVELTAGECKALSLGVRPFMIRPQSLVLYYPLDGLEVPEPDLSGNIFSLVNYTGLDGSGTYASGYTVISRNGPLVNGKTVSSVDIFANSAFSGKLKIMLRNGVGDFTLIQEQAWSHGGTGWENTVLSSPYSVPVTGNYYPSIYSATNPGASCGTQPRSYKAGDVGTATGFSEDIGPSFGCRVPAILTANNGLLSGTSFAVGPPTSMFTPRWPRNYDPVAVTTVPLSQTHFRFRTDTNAVDATPTWGDAEDAA